MFVIRVSYPGGHSVWLTRRFPTVAWDQRALIRLEIAKSEVAEAERAVQSIKSAQKSA
jgi:hypothetical protein